MLAFFLLYMFWKQREIITVRHDEISSAIFSNSNFPAHKFGDVKYTSLFFFKYIGEYWHELAVKMHELVSAF